MYTQRVVIVEWDSLMGRVTLVLAGWPSPPSLVEATRNSCSWHRSLSVSLYSKLSPLTPTLCEGEWMATREVRREGERERESEKGGGRPTVTKLALVSRLVMVTL